MPRTPIPTPGLRRIVIGFEILRHHGVATGRAVGLLLGLDTLGRRGHTEGIAQALTAFDAVHPDFTQAPRFASLHANATQHIDQDCAASETPATINELDDLFETLINHAAHEPTRERSRHPATGSCVPWRARSPECL